MRQRLMWLVLFSAAIMVTALHYAGNVWATPANAGFKATTIAMDHFGEIEVFNRNRFTPLPGDDQKDPNNVWLSLQKTKGMSDLYVQSNVWQPRGSTGWH